MEPRAIASILEKIARSSLSVTAYFQRYKVPFGRSQYFQYKARLAANGLEGLVDGRSQGNHRTLTTDAQAFIRGVHEADSTLSLRQIADRLESSLGIGVDPATVSRHLRAAGLKIQWPRPAEAQTIISSCGGFEIIGALALHLGWARHTAEAMVEERERFRRTVAYRRERVWCDREGRNAEGQFTKAYNRRADIRAQRFASVEDKRKHKNYSRMGLFQSSEFVLQRKCLGVLALPLITLNGWSRSANNPLGNALEQFCGYNYQHHTLDKFLRELKYLGISEWLLREQVSFWRQHWSEFDTLGLPFLCYYVDGNTKPLWSQKRVKQNKVTMLGRVMGCLEQVFVHDAFGHPVYLETYAGKAPLGEHILGLFEKIEAALEGPGPPLRVRRVIVMDAASNGVATLRAFASQEKYHYITALDDNQWNPRKEIADQEEQLAKAIEKELRIRSRAPVVDGQRKLPEAARRKLQVLSREIAASRRQVKVIESQWGKPLRRLRRYEKEWLRLQGKDHLYRIDVELDHIMGLSRVALFDRASWFLSESFEKHHMSFARLLHAILMMPAEIRLTKDARRVVLKRNPKDRPMMELLESALHRLTDLKIRDPSDRNIEFRLSPM